MSVLKIIAFGLMFIWRTIGAFMFALAGQAEQSESMLLLALEAAVNVIVRGVSPTLCVTFTVSAPDQSGALYASNTDDIRWGINHFIETLDRAEGHERLKQAHAEAAQEAAARDVARETETK